MDEPVPAGRAGRCGAGDRRQGQRLDGCRRDVGCPRDRRRSRRRRRIPVRRRRRRRRARRPRPARRPRANAPGAAGWPPSRPPRRRPRRRRRRRGPRPSPGSAPGALPGAPGVTLSASSAPAGAATGAGGGAGGGGASGVPGRYCTTPSRARARRSSKSSRVLNDSTSIRRFFTSMPSRVVSTTRLLNISKFSASSSSRVCRRWLTRANSSRCLVLMAGCRCSGCVMAPMFTNSLSTGLRSLRMARRMRRGRSRAEPSVRSGIERVLRREFLRRPGRAAPAGAGA